MALILGIDLGTTKTTAIAVDSDSGRLIASASAATKGFVASESDRARGRSEWDADRIVSCGLHCLRLLSDQLGSLAADAASLGITGQQHGCVVIDTSNRPLTPLINWQDQRGNEPCDVPGLAPPAATAGTDQQPPTWVQIARNRVGADAFRRTGCRLNTGFMATTLFWLHSHGQLPDGVRACFITDLFAARLTGESPATDPTLAGSAGVFNVSRRQWDEQAIEALGLRVVQFPAVREANELSGRLVQEVATETGLPPGVPVAIPIGDHQASFVGSVADRHSSVLIIVGTGAQVAVFTPDHHFEPPIELRPFPISGNLLSNVGLTGGWSFQVIEQFFSRVGQQLFGIEPTTPLYDRLTALAAQTEAGADNLRCTPTFSGTRANPEQRGSLTNITPHNLTPANLARAAIEGMAGNYRHAWDQITALGGPRQTRLVGAGNGLRENHVLFGAVHDAFAMTPEFTQHREEAAYGAALTAAVAAGVFNSIDNACAIIQPATAP